MKKHDHLPESFRASVRSAAFYSLTVLLASAVLCIALFRLDLIFGFLAFLFELFRTTFYGVIFAFLLFPFTRFISFLLNKLFFKKKPRPRLVEVLSVVLTYLLLIAVLAVLLLAFIPTMGSEASVFTRTVSGAIGSVRDMLASNDSLSFLRDIWNDTTLLFQSTIFSPQKIVGILGGVLSGAYNIAIGLIISVYMLLGRRHLGAICAKIMAATMPHTVATRAGMFFRSLYTCFMDFIFYRLIFAASMAVVTYLVCLVFAIPFRGFATLLLPFFCLIPVFGPILGTLIVTLAVLLVDPVASVILLGTLIAAYVLLHRLLGRRLLRPKLRPGIAPCAIAVFVFYALFGILGALLAVPVCAASSILLREIIFHILHQKGYRMQEHDLSIEAQKTE